MEWSTVVDAPVTFGMSLEEFKKHYKEEYGSSGMIELEERLKRVENNGTSGHPPFGNLEGLLSSNRAGANETHMEREDIIEYYCRQQKEPK